MTIAYQPNDSVNHPQYGSGQVIIDNQETVIIRFQHGIEECPKTSLKRLSTLEEAINAPQWHQPLEVITRIQALAIHSVNDVWGVFSLARINLLPHQLWVCRRVLQQLPTRWLVADDVGLGKTIEAGLILSALLTKNKVKRILIICPASLVEQWQYRLREMFDIRCTIYTTEADKEKSDFWNTHHQIIASLPTLRKNNKNRWNRLFNAEPWDLLAIDEAHHLNADEKTGQTLGYELIDQLINTHQKVDSAVFFTGTPHRGKTYEFFSLLKLLREDLFDPKTVIKSAKSLHEQMSKLREIIIRNNKQTVTNMQGDKLFYPLIVSSETYSYSHEETYFYDQLTEFILTGKAYASDLSLSAQRTVILVLICMQKLASSSVAAIRKALTGRLARISQNKKELELVKKQRDKLFEDLESIELTGSDELNNLEEKIAELTLNLRLMEDEKPRLEELIEASNQVKEETKINKILEILENKFKQRQVLFFTEYKATQSLLMSALMANYGENCVAFINGDERAENVVKPSEEKCTINQTRSHAAEQFNRGEVRFLISTEAGGEGIDLQENCYSLIHVDLPWNPMRLHQRVGRVNRYGQKQQVEVISLRNPDTVETRIWDKLNSKIANIMQSLDQVMDEPEDLLQLVLGMTSPKLFREIFSEAQNHQDHLTQWFDEKTATFGGKDAIETVKEIVCNVEKFDFQQISALLPQIDLPDLEPFFLKMLALNSRRITHTEAGISFITPENWRTEPAIRRNYENLHFSRQKISDDNTIKTLAVGHKLFNQALQQATEFMANVTTFTGLKYPLFIFQIIDRVTGTKTNAQQIIAGVELRDYSIEKAIILKDWEIIHQLNDYLKKGTTLNSIPDNLGSTTEIMTLLKEAENLLRENLPSLNLPFQIPNLQAIAVFYPSH